MDAGTDAYQPADVWRRGLADGDVSGGARNFFSNRIDSDPVAVYVIHVWPGVCDGESEEEQHLAISIWLLALGRIQYPVFRIVHAEFDDSAHPLQPTVLASSFECHLENCT